MGTRLFIGNLSYNVTEQELREAFTGEGIELRSVRVALDRETGRPRGFAFVETMTDEGAKASIEKLSGPRAPGTLDHRGGGAGKTGGATPRRFRRPAPSRWFRRPPAGPAARAVPADLPAVPAAPAAPAAPRGPAASAPRGRAAAARRLRSPARPGRLPRRAAGPGGRGPDAPPRSERARPEKKTSTRPKPEERERGNWRWDRNPDDE